MKKNILCTLLGILLFAVSCNGGGSGSGNSKNGGTPGSGDNPSPPVITANYQYLAVGFGGRTVASEDGTTWEEIIPGKDHLIDIAYGDGTYIAVGSKGAIYRSTDGTTWNELPERFERFTSVVFGDGIFLATGNTVLMSSDQGEHWTAQEILYSEPTSGAVFAQNKFLVTSSTRSITYNTQSGTWGTMSTFSCYLHSPSYVNGSFVMTGDCSILDYTQKKGILATSSDGETWTSSSYNNLYPQCIAYGNNSYIMSVKDASGSAISYQFLMSNDLETDLSLWSATTIVGNQPKKMLYAKDRFAYIGLGNEVKSSTNGTDWDAANDLGIISQNIQYLNNQIFLVGNNGGIMKSYDATTWETVREQSSPIGMLAYCNGTFFGSYQASGYLHAFNGINRWETTAADFSSFNCRNMIYTGSSYIAIAINAIWTSTDAITWNKNNHYNSRSIARNNDCVLVVGGFGKVYMSKDDATTWEEASYTVDGQAGTDITGHYMLKVVYADAVSSGFYAIDNNYNLLKSNDGITWYTHGQLPILSNDVKIAVGNGVLVAMTAYDIAYYNLVSKTWETAQYPEIDSSNTLKDMTFDNGLFVIAGNGGLILTSTDGKTWNEKTVEGFDLYAVSGVR